MPVVTPIAPYVLLENSLETGPEATSFLFAGAQRIIRCEDGTTLVDALREIDAEVAKGRYAAGWMAYEAGYWLEPKLAPLRGRAPADGCYLWFGIFDAPQILKPRELEAFWLGRNEGIQDFEVADIALGLEEAAYMERIRTVKDYLAAGDIYEANFTMPCSFRFDGNVEALHRQIRQSQRVPYGAVLFTGDESILSYSPELFVEKRGSRLKARPMKGTAARGFTADEDQARRAELQSDAKQRAELLMIVDLLRNDLGRLARVGSVTVTEPYRVETYRTVLQMTTTVGGEVGEDLSLEALMRGLFPCGSITGAPKIRAMEIIAELETGPRGVYTGAIGFITPARDMTFAVPIRTLRIGADGSGVLGVGSGIVADSDPAAEFRECKLKAAFFAEPQEDFALIETMRAEAGQVALLDRHLDRLSKSAGYFGFPCDVPEIRRALEDLLGQLADAGLQRVRLLLDRQGEPVLTAVAYQPPREEEPLVIGLARETVQRDDPMLYHKTTSRRRYSEALTQAQAAGMYDLVFFNDEGEATEGARSNIIVEQGGRLLTPPVTSGLLGGVMRADLLSKGRIEEAVVTRDMLDAADTIYICNAMIGLRSARLVA